MPQNDNTGTYIAIGAVGIAGFLVAKALGKGNGGGGGGGIKKPNIHTAQAPTFDVFLIKPIVVDVTQDPTFDIVML